MVLLDPSSSSISTPTSLIPFEHPLQVEAITYMDTDLFKAAEDGDMELFEKYQDGFHCLVDRRQNTALHIYSRSGGRQVVKNNKRFLCFQKRRFEREFSINFVKQLVDNCPSLLLQPNAKGEISLHIAARHGHSDIVKFLIERAKAVQQKDLEKGSEATCRMKQMLRMRDKDGNTAVHKAVESGDLNVVRLLVKELDPDFSFSANTRGETPLYIAANTGRNLLVAEILDNCKSVEYGGPDGRTALHAAVMACDEKSVRNLIKANKQLTKETDNNGWTPLHHASHYGYRYRPIMLVLLESEASAAFVTDKERGMTALHWAAWGGRKTIMEDIISHCPDCCEIVDKRGWNFLHFTVLTLGPKRLERFLLGDKNKIKDLPIRNLLDEKDVNGISPSGVLFYGRAYRNFYSQYGRIFEFLKIHGSENLSYSFLRSQTQVLRKEQIRKLLKDIAKDEEVAGYRYHHIRKIVKDQEDEENDISQQEIEEKARESHLVVATLIATVTFAAAFTVPGGYRSDEQGTATLIRYSAFKAFVITDILAFVSSLLAIFVHFFALMLSVKFKDWSIYDIINIADHLTIFAMAAMVLAFSTGTYAVLEPSSGFASVALSFGLFFFPIPVLCYGMWFSLD